MKLGSPIEEKKARIEIIPLIDIMFFLLACFMAVSLSMIQMRGMKVNIPVAKNVQSEPRDDFTTITVDTAGTVYLEKERMYTNDELTKRIRGLHEAKADLRVYVKADKFVSHGEVIGVLDAIRSAGVTKVAFELKAQTQVDPNQVPPPTQPPPTTAPSASGSSPSVAPPAPVAPPNPPAPPPASAPQ